MIGSRDAGRAAEAAERVRERAREGGASDRASRAFRTRRRRRARTRSCSRCPSGPSPRTSNNLRGALQPQTVLVDATVPLAAAIGGRATRTLGVWQGSAAQQAEEMAPRGVTVVSGASTP